jgi:hypothetical protein
VETKHPEMGLHMGWMAVPDIEDMVYRLECVYRMADKNSGLQGRQWVEQNCSIPIIMAQWEELLRYVGAEVKEEVKEHRMVLT